MIAATLSINPAMEASASPVALAMKASKFFGMLAQVAPKCSRELVRSSVGASLAGNMTCIGRLHPAPLFSVSERPNLQSQAKLKHRADHTSSPKRHHVNPCRHHILRTASQNDHSLPLEKSSRIVW